MMMNDKSKRCTADTRGVLANTPDNRRPSSVKRRRTGRKKRSSGAKSCARIEANGLRVSFESFPSSGAILSPKSARIGFFWPFSASSWPCLATSWTTVSSCAITVCLFYDTEHFVGYPYHKNVSYFFFKTSSSVDVPWFDDKSFPAVPGLDLLARLPCPVFRRFRSHPGTPSYRYVFSSSIIFLFRASHPAPAKNIYTI